MAAAQQQQQQRQQGGGGGGPSLQAKQQQFNNRLESGVHTVLQYEDPTAQACALSVIPTERLEAEAGKSPAHHTPTAFMKAAFSRLSFSFSLTAPTDHARLTDVNHFFFLLFFITRDGVVIQVHLG